MRLHHHFPDSYCGYSKPSLPSPQNPLTFHGETSTSNVAIRQEAVTDAGMDDDTQFIWNLTFTTKADIRRLDNNFGFCIAILTDVYAASTRPFSILLRKFDRPSFELICLIESDEYEVKNVPVSSPLQPISLKAIALIFESPLDCTTGSFWT